MLNDKQCRSRSVGFDLDLHCVLRQGMSCSAREGLSGRGMQTLIRVFAESYIFSCYDSLANKKKYIYIYLLRTLTELCDCTY